MVYYNADTEKRLIMMAKKGDISAFNQLYDAHFDAVYHRVRYKIPERDIEDVTQEIFIAMVKGLKGFKGNSSLKTWLRTITNRKIADYYRKSNYKVFFQEDEQVLDGLDDQEEMRFRRQQDNAILLKRSLMQLPDHYQEIILLRFVDEYKFKEIAQIMEKSLEATKSLYRRAIQALRDEVDNPNAIQ
jgi:RNA polymerase sigma-70 factor (ECF subfamily)